MGWVNNPMTSTNVVHRNGTEIITGNKTFTSPIKLSNSTSNTPTIKTDDNYAALDKNPPEDDGEESTKIATVGWVRKVIQVDDETVVKQYVSPSGDDNNDGKSVETSKKTITKAMETLNKYRLSSATGLDISLYISGDYDLNTYGISRPIIAHPDAINQNKLLISGTDDPRWKNKDKIKYIHKLDN